MLSIPVVLSVSVLLVVVASCVCTFPSSKLVWLNCDVASLTRPVYGDELSITAWCPISCSICKRTDQQMNVLKKVHAPLFIYSTATVLLLRSCDINITGADPGGGGWGG